ncbi:hypothetical protein [Acaryochloris sp. IP29b_bin.148]|uniref:hypothetical protein n=1 Tax=Acaryochloris sp. IP29b_bin.148 TaxID=2969218 RepID=UPI002622FFC7|nr:hypothetical protein [Acaryochloris sp. IP29b_bin.148]
MTLMQMHNAGVPTKHVNSGHRTLAPLSGYLKATDEQVEGAIAKLVFGKLEVLIDETSPGFNYPLWPGDCGHYEYF